MTSSAYVSQASDVGRTSSPLKHISLKITGNVQPNVHHLVATSSVNVARLKPNTFPWRPLAWNMFLISAARALNGGVFHFHQFLAISEFKLELQAGNAKFGSKSAFIVLCDLELWRMTLKNNRAPLLCCFKLYASLHSNQWIHTGVTVRKRLIPVKIGDFLSRVTLKFDIWPWKTIRHLFYAASSSVHSNWSYGP